MHRMTWSASGASTPRALLCRAAGRLLTSPLKKNRKSRPRNWNQSPPEGTMIDFSTNYLGLKLKGPIVVSSTPISESIENVCRMEESGASAIVLTSLFEEQLA